MRMLALPYAATYAALTGVDQPANWLIGLLVGGALALVSGRRRGIGGGARARLVGLPWLAVGVVGRIASGTRQMLRVLLTFAPWPHAGFVRIGHVARSDDGLTLLALVVSASPGSAVLQIERDANVVVANVIDARNPPQVDADVSHFYHRYQRRLVP